MVQPPDNWQPLGDKATPCPYCNAPIEVTQGIVRKADGEIDFIECEMKKGMIIMCVSCLELCMFDENINIVKTPPDALQIIKDTNLTFYNHVLHVRSAAREVKALEIIKALRQFYQS